MSMKWVKQLIVHSSAELCLPKQVSQSPAGCITEKVVRNSGIFSICVISVGVKGVQMWHSSQVTDSQSCSSQQPGCPGWLQEEPWEGHASHPCPHSTNWVCLCHWRFPGCWDGGSWLLEQPGCPSEGCRRAPWPKGAHLLGDKPALVAAGNHWLLSCHSSSAAATSRDSVSAFVHWLWYYSMHVPKLAWLVLLEQNTVITLLTHYDGLIEEAWSTILNYCQRATSKGSPGGVFYPFSGVVAHQT